MREYLVNCLYDALFSFINIRYAILVNMLLVFKIISEYHKIELITKMTNHIAGKFYSQMCLQKYLISPGNIYKIFMLSKIPFKIIH